MPVLPNQALEIDLEEAAEATRFIGDQCLEIGPEGVGNGILAFFLFEESSFATYAFYMSPCCS